MKEKRTHERFPALSIIKTVEINRGAGKESIPAIMYNISEGGMAIITFLPLPSEREIILNLNFSGIDLHEVHAKIIRTEEKKGTYLIALKFLKIPAKTKKIIKKMASDWKACEDESGSHNKIDCSNCSYYQICTKSIKKRYARHQSSA